jgi:pilus assembly protein TadC
VAHLTRLDHRVRIGLGAVREVDLDRPVRAGGRSAVRTRHCRSDAPDAAAIADALELMALVLGAGSGVIDAVEAVARTSPAAVREDLTIVAAAVRWGMAWPVAWEAVGAAWAPARRAMALADAAGVAPAAALRGAAADLRAAQLLQVEFAAARLGVMIVLPLGLAFLPAFVLLTVVPLVVALAGEVWG